MVWNNWSLIIFIRIKYIQPISNPILVQILTLHYLTFSLTYIFNKPLKLICNHTQAFMMKSLFLKPQWIQLSAIYDNLRAIPATLPWPKIVSGCSGVACAVVYRWLMQMVSSSALYVNYMNISTLVNTSISIWDTSLITILLRPNKMHCPRLESLEVSNREILVHLIWNFLQALVL